MKKLKEKCIEPPIIIWNSKTLLDIHYSLYDILQDFG
jgi:hypothetical protein